MRPQFEFVKELVDWLYPLWEQPVRAIRFWVEMAYALWALLLRQLECIADHLVDGVTRLAIKLIAHCDEEFLIHFVLHEVLHNLITVAIGGAVALAIWLCL